MTAPVVPTQQDRDWLCEDIWLSIPRYMHKSIEDAAARYRETVCLAALEEAARVAWQPIETAPKDGREILMAYGNGTGDVSPPMVVAWCKKIRGWFIVGVEIEVLTKPTHWMPLPAPPTETPTHD